MPDEASLNRDFAIDIDTMRILMTAKASKTAITIEEFIRLSLANGASPESVQAELIRDLNEGGRIFGEFRSAIRATSNGVIHRMVDSAQYAEMINVPRWRWVAVLVNSCDDCIERHGRTMTWAEWEEQGLPKTGHTVCKELCKCKLMPADSTVLKPIVRKKK